MRSEHLQAHHALVALAMESALANAWPGCLKRLPDALVINQLTVVESCWRGIGVACQALFVLDMQHFDAAQLQNIRHHGAVASPPEHFGTHDRGGFLGCQAQELLYPAGELVGVQVFGVATKRAIAPCTRARPRRGPPPAPQRFDPLIGDPVLGERGFEGCRHELR